MRSPATTAATPDTVSRVIEGRVSEPRRVNPSVPRDLETIVLKTLSKASRDRYANAAALAADLERFL